MAGSRQPSQQSQASYTALLPVIQTQLSAAPCVHLVFHQLQDQTRTSITAPIHVPRLLNPLELLDLTLSIAIPSIYKISRHRPPWQVAEGEARLSRACVRWQWVGRNGPQGRARAFITAMAGRNRNQAHFFPNHDHHALDAQSQRRERNRCRALGVSPGAVGEQPRLESLAFAGEPAEPWAGPLA